MESPDILSFVTLCIILGRYVSKMTASRILKWVTGAFEAILGIPVLGAAIVIGLMWIPLGVMFILHIVTLVLSKQNNEPIYGSIMGVITSLVAWIPGVGIIMHILSAIFLMVTAAKASSVAVRETPHAVQ
jgi:hypothetical protein